jgi:oxalate decarboxylase/phosphoglucose isomerase-like protein (cupin superfamily)
MHPKFEEIFTRPENDIFKVVFFPDRIYHAQYLNATRSERYRYNVQEVRGYLDINVLKGEVYLDGEFLCNFLRIEYRASRLVEQIRERQRFLRDEVMVNIKLLPDDLTKTAQAALKMHYDAWIDAFQVEIWETLEAPPNKIHDFSVLDLMGKNRSITRVKSFSPVLRNIKALGKLELFFRESDRDVPTGYKIQDNNAGWDNNYLRSHQEPLFDNPSDSRNTVQDNNYLINFQRGWFRQASDVKPVLYRNAMMEADKNPDAHQDNIIQMRWLFQREFSGSVVFFHEVTIPPGKVEGTHQHIGSEELYYIYEGEGFAYMRVGDDPDTDQFPTVEREIFGIGKKDCKELPVKPGSMIFTKSGGIHGIANPNDKPLKFVAFLYHQ